MACAAGASELRRKPVPPWPPRPVAKSPLSRTPSPAFLSVNLQALSCGRLTARP